VTHDQEEAFTIADRVLILHHGEIIRAGTAAEVWANPEFAFVAGFLGLGSVIQGIYIGAAKVETKIGILTVRCAHKHAKGDNVHLLVRPLSAGKEPSMLEGIVTDAIFQQDRFKVNLDNGLYVYLPQAPQVGEKIKVRVKVECLGGK
jgi:ABC-type Fe3+/spermidine/putrescine transport system ATPase subunit